MTDAEIRAARKKFENVPPTVNAVLVVANYPTTELSALQGLTTGSAVENYRFDVASQFLTTGVTKKTLMGKSTTLTPATNPTPSDPDVYYEVNVALDALTSRLEIGNVIPGTNVRNVKLEGVWINNFRNGNDVTTPTLYDQNNASWQTNPSASWVGSETPMTIYTIPPYTPSQYHNGHSSEVNGSSKVYAFQLFAGNYVPHIILLVSGQYNNDKYFLGWLTFNKLLDNSNSNNPITGLEKNVIYKIGLSGIPVNAGDLTDKPEMASIDLGVQCTITPWTVKNVTPSI